MVFLPHQCRHSPELRAQIGRYANLHSTHAASCYFSKKTRKKVSDSSAQSMKLTYQREKRITDDEITNLPVKKHGWSLLLGKEVDMLQLYVKKTREQWGSITASVIVSASRGILMARDRMELAEFGCHIVLNRQWAFNLLYRMHFVRRKATTSKSKLSTENFVAVKQAFLDDVVSTVAMKEIPFELILNWDHTGIHLVPASGWTMDRVGSKRVEVTGVNDKHQITAIFCGNIAGYFLPIQLIYKGKTDRCHPKFMFPTNWHITHRPKHWSTKTTMIQFFYITEIIVPHVQSQWPCRPKKQH